MKPIARLRSLPKVPLVAAALAVVAVLVLGWRWIVYLHGPGPVAAEFVAAIERHDVARIYALALDQEKNEMGLTQAAVERALNEILYHRAPQLRSSPSRMRGDDSRARNWQTFCVAWTDAATGKPLPSPRTGEFSTAIDLFQRPDGHWQVSFTRFAGDYLLFNGRPAEYYRLRYAERNAWIGRWWTSKFRQWGLPGTCYAPATIKVDGQVVALLDTSAYEPEKRPPWRVAR